MNKYLKFIVSFLAVLILILFSITIVVIIKKYNQVEDKHIENLEITMPAVVSTDLRLNEPRYASLPNIMKAKKKPINEIKIEDLNVEIRQRLNVLKVEEPSKRQSGIMVKTVEELVEKLKNEAKVI